MQPLFSRAHYRADRTPCASTVRWPTLFGSLCRCATIGRCDYAIRSLLVSDWACTGAALWRCGGIIGGPLAAPQRSLNGFSADLCRGGRPAICGPPIPGGRAHLWPAVAASSAKCHQPLLDQRQLELLCLRPDPFAWRPGHSARPQSTRRRRPVYSPGRHAQCQPGGPGRQPPVRQQRQPAHRNALLGVFWTWRSCCARPSSLSRAAARAACSCATTRHAS